MAMLLFFLLLLMAMPLFFLQGAETNGGCTPMLPSMSGCSVPLLWALVHITIMPRMACRQGGTSISPTLGMVESLGPQIQESLIQNSWMIQKVEISQKPVRS